MDRLACSPGELSPFVKLFEALRYAKMLYKSTLQLLLLSSKRRVADS